jgi:hypothetical protein
MKLGFISLTQSHMIIMEYKVKFNEHASYFLTLKQLDRIDFFKNELDKSIKFVIQSHELTTKTKVYWKVSLGGST